ncbi:MAG: hypothetical protein E7056_02580 [Lentisphaerae bacterium]|nr:hypothetical protein [Lentisphaerota bacterium]
MKIFIVTDIEGVAGVLDFENYCTPRGAFYEMGKRLLTEEVNACIDGFFAGGATEVLVCDGHGHGAIDPELLDERATLQRGAATPVWPFTLDETFDGIAWVGQHAKSRTPWSHISHTGSFNVKELTANGVAIGEFGKMALAAAELGVPVIFAGGEDAFAREAEELAPGVVAVGVKKGCNSEDGLDEVSDEVYAKSKLSAIHLAPKKARKLLREGAKAAAEKLRREPDSFKTNLMPPPYELKCVFRKVESNPDFPAVLYQRHDKSFIGALNAPYEKE